MVRPPSIDLSILAPTLGGPHSEVRAWNYYFLSKSTVQLGMGQTDCGVVVDMMGSTIGDLGRAICGPFIFSKSSISMQM